MFSLETCRVYYLDPETSIFGHFTQIIPRIAMKINIQSPLVCLFALLIASNAVLSPASAQQKLSEAEIAAGQKEYEQLVGQWRSLIKEVYRKQLEFKMVTIEESSNVRKQWQEKVAEAQTVFDKIEPLATDLFLSYPEPSKELTDLMMRITNNYFVKGQYEKADELAERILKITGKDIPMMIYIRGRAALFMNKFDDARKFATDYSAMLNNLPDKEKILFDVLDYLSENFEKEKKFRKQEAEADDLPRVEIKTTKGTILVELFENEAPNTVGNFISLIEKGYYDGKIFHRVLNNFMAQGGAYTSQGQFAQPDYYIYDECGKEDARGHFRGVLSMAKGNDPHTANSQFFITYVPVPHLDGKHTVFGRVLKGMRVADELSRTFSVDDKEKEVPIRTAIPDQIISMKVIRKRDHEYVPDKFIEQN